MFRRIRIAVLLFVLLIVALNTWTDSLFSTSWDAPMTVALFPINADASETSRAYIDKLDAEQFEQLEQFFHEEAERYGVPVDRPVRFTLAPPLNTLPPMRPETRSKMATMQWSLQLRWWAWRHVPKAPGPTPRIRLFLLFYDPAKHSSLDHSTALKKGLIGVVQLFADKSMRGANYTVVAHELLHTLGATDKYDLATGHPLNPDGLAEPERTPLYPQQFAELMGGRIALSAKEAAIPESLQQVIIGPITATEIGWLKE